MSDIRLFCAPGTDICNQMSEWAVFWQALGAIAAVIFGVFGLVKIYQELRRLNEQRRKELEDKEISAQLKRTEFFLSQHRRLFDNAELFEVLCLVDADDEKLIDPEIWDKKRKFLTFFEEIALLVESRQIKEHVAYYMFGYYARCAVSGKNFQVGSDLWPDYWGLLLRFVKAATDYSNVHTDSPPVLSLGLQLIDSARPFANQSS